MAGFSVYSQGCSDAGICTLDSYVHNDSLYKNSLEISPGFAVGEADVTYVTGFLAYTRILSKKWVVSGRVTYSQASGSFGTRGQFGDVFATAGYTISNKQGRQLLVTFGAKFPFTQSNLKINGYSLPMDYQASLGTFDALLGVSWKTGRLNLNASLQYPVININKNSYIAEYSGTDDFPTTNLFERRPDVLLKGLYTFTFGKLTLRPGLLSIYHLGEDSYEDIFGRRRNIEGSAGLTLNGLAEAAYSLHPQHTLELLAATPFVVRDERPDGLTRSLVLGFTYNYKF